jgi:hypothetical protein
MATSISMPIAIVDEHPEWSSRLIAELQSRRLPFEKIDHSTPTTLGTGSPATR